MDKSRPGTPVLRKLESIFDRIQSIQKLTKQKLSEISSLQKDVENLELEQDVLLNRVRYLCFNQAELFDSGNLSRENDDQENDNDSVDILRDSSVSQAANQDGSPRIDYSRSPFLDLRNVRKSRSSPLTSFAGEDSEDQRENSSESDLVEADQSERNKEQSESDPQNLSGIQNSKEDDEEKSVEKIEILSEEDDDEKKRGDEIEAESSNESTEKEREEKIVTPPWMNNSKEEDEEHLSGSEEEESARENKTPVTYSVKSGKKGQQLVSKKKVGESSGTNVDERKEEAEVNSRHQNVRVKIIPDKKGNSKKITRQYNLRSKDK